MEQTGTDRVVRQAVDQNEASRVAVLPVGVEGDRAVEAQVGDADLVQLAVRRPVCLRSEPERSLSLDPPDNPEGVSPLEDPAVRPAEREPA